MPKRLTSAEIETLRRHCLHTADKCLRNEHPNDVEDAAQVALLRVLPLAERGAAPALINQVINYGVADYCRTAFGRAGQSDRKRRSLCGTYSLDASPFYRDSLPDPSDPYAAVDEADWVRDVASRVPAGRQRDVLTAYLAGEGAGDTAARLGLSPGCVSVYLHEAKAAMRTAGDWREAI